jgi:PAS domain S-box-containing protein
MPDLSDESRVTPNPEGELDESDITELDGHPDNGSMVLDGLCSDCQAEQILLGEYTPDGFLVNDEEKALEFRGKVGSYLPPARSDPELNNFKRVDEDIALPLQSALKEAKDTDSLVRRDHIQIRRNDAFRKINRVVRPLAALPSERDSLPLFEELQQARATLAPELILTSVLPATPGYQSTGIELSTSPANMRRLVAELRGANEEAQCNNEELQSTNEELQAAQEELQSSNEELTTSNEEMQSRNSELCEVNNDLMNVLSSIQTPIVMLNGELRIRRYTPTAERVLRLLPTDIGQLISDIKPRINVPDLEDLLHRVISSREPFEREVQHEDGRWYSLRIQPYKTAQGRVEGAVLQLLDIDQLKLSIEELEHARDYAEAIIETVREPLLVLDHGLSILTANRAFFETFRTSPEETIDRSIYELDNGQWNLPKVSQLFDSLLLDGNMVVHDVEVEHDFARAGWRTFQLNARHLRRSQEIGLILLSIEDISDCKRTAEAKYRHLFEAAKDGIMIIDADTGEINDVNPFLTQLLAIPRADLIGKRFWKAEPLRDLQNRHLVLDRLQKEEVLRFPEISLKTKSRQRELQVEVVANIYQEGPKRFAQFNIRDITERKEFDQHLQQTARLESLGILAGGIAHDFNNLLVGILGNAGLALADAPAGTPYQSALKDVVYASQRAADLTRQMLAYAGKGLLKMGPLELSGQVREITKLVQSSIPKSVELKLTLAETLPSVEADAVQIQQVVMNLVINGAESIGELKKGQVRVSTRMEELSSDELRLNFASAGLNPGAYVVLEVADDGCGMDDNTRKRIFDPFFTTKFTGRGLGLAAVQGIVRGHHGGIRVSSTPGKGSVFQIALPALQDVKAASTQEPNIQDLHGTGLVLVVDDEEIVLEITRATLERYGYRILTAANGKLGVQAVRDHKDELALVILDSTMPVMGGEEALGYIKALAPELPVILSSGYDASKAISRSGEKGLAGFIHKPFMLTDLLETVKSALPP